MTPDARLIAALHQALYTALVPRANGSRHDRGCRNARVNARWYGCSDACQFATGALLLAQDWANAVEPAPAQLALLEAM